jgi:hypothetical protein
LTDLERCGYRPSRGSRFVRGRGEIVGDSAEQQHRATEAAAAGRLRAELEAWRASVQRYVAVETDEDAEAWVEGAARLCHPEIEWDLTDFAGIPELPLTLYGVDAVGAFWRDWFSSWTPHDLEFEMVDAGDSVVMLIERERVRARESGRIVTIGPYAQRATFAGGLMATWKAFSSQEQALALAFTA